MTSCASDCFLQLRIGPCAILGKATHVSDLSGLPDLITKIKAIQFVSSLAFDKNCFWEEVERRVEKVQSECLMARSKLAEEAKQMIEKCQSFMALSC